MAKTKTSATASNSGAKMHSVSHENCCDLGHCWLCWLFKSLIVLFCAFLVLWVGFYCGMLSSRSHTYRMDKVMQKETGAKPGLMSHTMSHTTMDQMMGDMTMALKDKTGEAFDKEFLIQMTVHHEGAVEMAKMGLERSQNPEIREFCQKIIDAQSAEIEQMEDWQAAAQQ